MKHLKRPGLAAALMVVAMCGLAGAATATQITPANTVVTFHSPNSVVLVHGSGAVSCATSTITGRTPTVPAATQSFPVTLTYSTGCTAFGFPTTVHVTEGCNTPGGTPILQVTSTGSDRAIGKITIPAACSIHIRVTSTECTLTVRGEQTVGNGTVGFGGMHLTGGTSPVVHLNNTLVPTISVNNPTNSGTCPATGHRSGTLTGTYSSATTIHID